MYQYTVIKEGKSLKHLPVFQTRLTDELSVNCDDLTPEASDKCRALEINPEIAALFHSLLSQSPVIHVPVYHLLGPDPENPGQVALSLDFDEKIKALQAQNKGLDQNVKVSMTSIRLVPFESLPVVEIRDILLLVWQIYQQRPYDPNHQQHFINAIRVCGYIPASRVLSTCITQFSRPDYFTQISSEAGFLRHGLPEFYPQHQSLAARYVPMFQLEFLNTEKIHIRYYTLAQLVISGYPQELLIAKESEKIAMNIALGCGQPGDDLWVVDSSGEIRKLPPPDI